MRRDGGRYITSAGELLAHPKLSSWTDRAPDRRELHTTVLTGKRVDPRTEFHGNAIPLTDEDLAEGAGDLYPWFASYETSALMPNGLSPQLVFVAQTPPDHKFPSPHTRVVLKQKAALVTSMPVFSINSVEDWQAFCRAYPRVSTFNGETVPDWDAARKGLAGMHVSTFAMLTLDPSTFPGQEFGSGSVDPTDPDTDVNANDSLADRLLAEEQLHAFTLDLDHEIVLWFNPARDLEIVEELPPLRGGRDIPHPQPKLDAPPELQSRFDRWKRSAMARVKASIQMDYGPAISARTPPPHS